MTHANPHHHKCSLKNLLLFFVLLLPAVPLYSQVEETSGDRKIREMKERMLEAQKEKEKEEQEEKAREEKEKKKKHKEKKGQDEEGQDAQDEEDSADVGLFAAFFDIFFQISLAARFADYPYAHPDIYAFTTFDFENAYGDDREPESEKGRAPPLSRKLAYLTLSSSGAWLGDDLWSSTTRCDANMLPLHFNVLYQWVFSAHDRFSLLALNGGFSFFFPFLTLNTYLGMFRFDPLEGVALGMGLSTQIYLPSHFLIDFYNVNAFFEGLELYFFSCSLNYALDRFNLGVGAEISSYAGTLYWGPYLRLSLWV